MRAHGWRSDIVIQMKVLYSLFPLTALVFAPALPAQTTYTYASVDYPGAAYTQLNGINSAGEIVGIFGNTSAGNAAYSFLRSANGSYTPLLANTASDATAISNSGVIVGSANYSGFIISHGDFTPVSSTKYITFLSGISSKNQIVGYFFDGFEEYYGFETIGGKLVELPYYENEPVRPQGINGAGTIVGYPEAEITKGFILPAGGVYQLVQYPGAVFGTQLAAINDSGVSAGIQYNTNSSYGQGFTYNGTVFSDVIYPGSQNTTPQGISNSGVVVGFYFDASSVAHGFIATPIL